MFCITEEMNAEQIVRKMHNYMVERGIGFRSFNVNQSPYAILKGGTSIGYKKHTNHGECGIVFYCAKDGIDKDALEKELELIVYDNSEKCRPYALYIPIEKFERAVEMLCNNELNLL